MKIQHIYTIFFFSLVGGLLCLFLGFSFGPAASSDKGYTGAPGDASQVCATCHGGNAFGVTTVTLTSQGNTPTYDLLSTTPMEVTVLAPMGTPGGYGFQLIALNDDDTPLDVTYSNISTNAKETTIGNGRKYLEHSGTSATNTFTFDFQPNAVTGTEVKFYVVGNAVDGTGGTANDSGSESFVFVLKDIALAVELADFRAASVRDGIQLDWMTETETENDYFAVEHSTNGTDFSTLKTVSGAGTSQTRNIYNYTHNTPASGINYYRLRIVEFEGKTTYSNVMVEKFIGARTITAFPQPAESQATIRVYTDMAEAAMLEVHNLAGQIVSMKSIALEREENLIDLDCRNWAAGHYMVTVSGAQLGQQSVRLFVK